jgi:hypothetical protein
MTFRIGFAAMCMLCSVSVVELPAQQPQQPPAEQHELSAEQAAAINFAYGGMLDYRYDDHCRAGFSQSIHPHALPSRTRYYGGYYVGGGVPVFGEGRYPDEGTFGWDFLGIVPKRVALNWTHGRREQGNGGTYKTDGPKRHAK